MFSRRISYFLAIALLSASLDSYGHEMEENLARYYDLTLDEIKAQTEQASETHKLELTVMSAMVAASKSSITEASGLIDDLRPLEQVRTTLGADWYWAVRATDGWLKARGANLEDGASQCAEALANIDSVKPALFQATIYSCNSFVSIRRGDLATALNFTQKTVYAAELGGSFDQYSGALSNEALLLYYAGIYDASMQRFEQLISMEDRLDLAALRIVRFNLGLVYMEVGQYEQALSAFEEGTRWTRETGQTQRELIAHTYKAKALNALHRPEEAIATLAGWLSASNESAESESLDLDSLTNALATAAGAYLELSNAEEALALAERGLEITTPLRWGELALIKAKALRALNRTANANDYLTQSIEQARTANDRVLSAMLAEQGKIAAEQGQFELAYSALNESAMVSNEDNEAKLAQRLSTMDSIFELEKTREALKLLEATTARDAAETERRYLIVLIILGLVVVGLGITFLFRERRAQMKEIQRQKTESEKLETLVAERTQALEERVSEVMHQRNELVQLQKQLDEAEKLRALGTLTGGVAHDFNNLLAIIIGSASVLETDPELSDQDQRELLESILNAGEAGSRITASLLAYARRQPLNPRNIEISNSIKDARLILEKAVGNERKLIISAQPGIVKVDPGALITAIINLLVNAADACNPGDTILLHANARPEKHQYIIEVIDEGEGMSEDQIQHVFEPFYSTKSASRSTGLGLSMVHGFTHQSGGEISISSKPDQGTTVRLLLPLREGNIDDALPSSKDTSEPRKIICVDDNELVLGTLVKMLKTNGHEVDAFSDTTSGLAAIKAKPYDLMISDVVMPGDLSGVEFANQAIAISPHIRILLMSGFADIDSITQDGESWPMLSKPFTSNELQARINELFTTETI